MRCRFLPLLGLALAVCLAGTACQEETKTGGDAQADIKHGWDSFRQGEFKAAVEFFQAAEAEAPPTDSRHAEAVYGEATLWNLRRPDNDRSRARKLYQQVIDGSPQSDLAAWSAFEQVVMLYPPGSDQTPDLKAISQGYQEVIDHFPGHVAAEEAFMAQQAIVLQRFDAATTREAVARLEKFMTDHPDSHFHYCALMLAGGGYQTLGQWRELVDARLRASKVYDAVTERMARDPQVGMLMSSINWMTNYWTIASVSEFQLGDFATAREYYRRICDRAPTDPLYGEALVALKRMDDKEAEIRREIAGTH